MWVMPPSSSTSKTEYYEHSKLLSIDRYAQDQQPGTYTVAITITSFNSDSEPLLIQINVQAPDTVTQKPYFKQYDRGILS